MSDDTRTGTAGTTALVVLGGVAVLLGAAHWAAVNLAALLTGSRRPHVGVGQALVALGHLPAHLSDPRLAWPIEQQATMPRPGPYQAALLVMAVVVVGLVVVGVVVASRLGRRPEAVNQRRRLGVHTEPRLAKTRDLGPLLLRRPEPNRFVVGRWHRRLLATEGTTFRGQRGVLGAVAVIGPSQSGKTTGLIDGLQLWQGPAVVCSVKTDLMQATIAARREHGEVRVFDPFGLSGQPSTTWSPLRATRELEGAKAAASLLAHAHGEGSPNDAFWRGQAEQLLAAMLWTAANTVGHTMRDVVRWVLELDRPNGEGENGTLAPLVRLLTDNEDEQVAAEARQVQGWLQGQWKTDPRTTSSVYATARDAVWPWANPKIAATADTCDVTLDWLLGGANTLYLCAPLGDNRLGLVFSSILQDLIEQAFARSNRDGPPERRLLALLDETANTPLPKLPQWASTVTGAGIQLVTVWQSKAQVDRIHTDDADTVLTNHRTKLVYPSGLSDPSSIRYLSHLVGDEHVRGQVEHRSPFGAANASDSAIAPAMSSSFLSAHVLRQLCPGDGLLLHGDRPPVWLPHRRRATRHASSIRGVANGEAAPQRHRTGLQ